jgi:hypothetical protein
MSIPRKPLAALAAMTAAAAVALPAATASAATNRPMVDPTVCQLLSQPFGLISPTWLPGGPSLADTLARAGATVGCSAPAAPAFPWQR